MSYWALPQGGLGGLHSGLGWFTVPEMVVLALGFHKGWFSACRYRVLGFLGSGVSGSGHEGSGFRVCRLENWAARDLATTFGF